MILYRITHTLQKLKMVNYINLNGVRGMTSSPTTTKHINYVAQELNLEII